ncbi:biotin--[acetyl-CoA-carboxylase] ligase [Wolbachia endosymbiont of Pentalonia nigronervosa]|uniref:biotin--[acetyl-CoA-carboxylase] ligase n=1 Tax=Wolbachia endosymbiont of Pentalonia nigronervosa TaxID=1301914 RepID=UPI00165FFC22|nr:biotin--[acetyl-CoA-carboxylase] ligase [Wolbachia endosymbiont of Pentalonia nigronervosa]MBD0391112.1 biotin--[acetyl-CoA-carboxylase] ligase [Wolbachia endosymbiont of Pentalonia nigronervosa]
MTFKTFAGFHIHHYKEVVSTNIEALDLIDKKIANETAIIANKQTGGKGRTGKVWISPEGNLYVSLIINQVTDINKLTEFTFIAALAVGSTLLSLDLLQNRFMMRNVLGETQASTAEYLDVFEEHRQVLTTKLPSEIGFARGLLKSDLHLQYKWPNDVLIDNKKISGILLEKKFNSNWLVIGIGINITYAPLPGTTCISDYGNSISNIDLLKELIINFNRLRKQWLLCGFYDIQKMWLKRAFKLNEQVRIRLADKLYTGTFTDIDEYGRLVLQQEDKNLIYFNVGELFDIL